jgi:hypothetical protein
MNTDMTPDEIMERAADLLDEHGWCRGVMRYVYTGEMCIVGALRSVTLSEYVNADLVFTFTIPLPTLEMYNNVCSLLNAGGDINITDWNDYICSDRNEATDFLRNGAKRYREETQ